MKVLDKIGLALFSSIVLIGSLLVILAIAEWLEVSLILDIVEFAITGSVVTIRW